MFAIRQALDNAIDELYQRGRGLRILALYPLRSALDPTPAECRVCLDSGRVEPALGPEYANVQFRSMPCPSCAR